MKEKNKNPKPVKGQVYEPSPSGSLGLLALGYKGLILWRDARRKFLLSDTGTKGGENGQKNS